MAKKQPVKKKRRVPKTVLRLPDLDQAKSAVLNSLSSVDAQRGHRHAIKEFVEWYCSEPRLSFSKTIVLRYRIHLEPRHLAPGTINLRLGAVRRLAYEASDCGLLRDHAKITSHLAAWPRGAGTRACRVPTHQDARRTCTQARPEESGRGRLRVRATSAL